METTYDCLGLPFIFRPLALLIPAALLVVIGGGVIRYQSGLVGSAALLLAASLIIIAVWQFAYTPTKIVVRESEIGFRFVLAPAEWYPSKSVSARVVARRSAWPSFPYALQFLAPRPWFRPGILFEPSMLMTADGKTIEIAAIETAIETAFGVPVTRRPR